MRTLFMTCILLFSLVYGIFAQPDIDPAGTHHNFGPVGVGLPSEWDLILVNIGDDVLYISSATPSLPEFTIFQPAFPVTMTPGESLAVTVVFVPTAVGHVGGFIEVVSNDPDEDVVTIDVEGEGINVVHISAPDTIVPAGAQIFLPIVIGDAVGLGITLIEMRLVFNKSVVTASGASLIGTIAESWNLSVESRIDQIEINLSGLTPLVGSGVLVYIDISVSQTALPGQSAPLILTDVTFNEGIPLAVPHDGLLTVAHYDISGQVVYYSDAAPVDHVLVSLQGGVVENTWTDTFGSYRLESVPGGRDYIVTPSKVGDVHGCINSYDAALVMRHSVGFLSLDPHQLLAADVTGDGTVGAFDVSFILQFRVGMIESFPNGEQWLFLPDRMSYDSLSSHQVDQDYIALAYGDVSGNWSRGGAMRRTTPGSDLRIDPAVVVSQTKEHIRLSVPVSIEGAEGIGAVDLEIGYDPSLLEVISVKASALTSDFQICFHDRGGRLSIALACTEDLNGDVPLLHLGFEVPAVRYVRSGIPIEISATVNDGIVVADQQQAHLTPSINSPPMAYGLGQNRPNPFNPSTDIHYQIYSYISSVHTTVKIYNVLGQEIRTLVDTFKAPGHYMVTWDGKDSDGREVASGIYVYRMVAGSFVSSKQMLLLR